MGLLAKRAGVWSETQPNGMYVKDGGIWKVPTEAFVKEAGVWESFFKFTDPQTFIWDGTDSLSYRLRGWNADDDGGNKDYPRQGSWNAGDFIGCMAWDHGLIRSVLATRPRIFGVWLRLTRRYNSGINGPVAPNIWELDPAFVDAGNQIITSSGQPTIANPNQQTAGMNAGETIWYPLPISVGEAFRDDLARGLAIANTNVLQDPGGQDSDYLITVRADRTNDQPGTMVPQLRIDCDFA